MWSKTRLSEPLIGKAIDMWRIDKFITATGKVAPAQVIETDQQHGKFFQFVNFMIRQVGLFSC